MKTDRHIILASGSPRRRELLAAAGCAFDVIVSDADEIASGALPPASVACENARLKAQAVAQRESEDAVVIGADTIVVLDGRIFGKPESEARAKEMLKELSGKTHEVITGVCIHTCGGADIFHESTKVVFRSLDEAEIEAYVATGEPLDKAGAYGIQGRGGALVDHIEGDYENVVGLPVDTLLAHLKSLIS